MFERFTAFLKTFGTDEPTERPDERLVASVALALAILKADGAVVASEKQALETLIRDHFGLDHDHFVNLLVVAEAEEAGSNDHYAHATYLRRHLDETARIELVAILWSLVDSDGVHNEMEDHMVWRIAEMLGVSGRDGFRLARTHRDNPGGH